MKKTLSFEKDLTFQTMIGEVTTISFEEDLKFVDKSSVSGNFYVSGQYKMTEASTILEDFSYSIPIEIATIENYDLETTSISVENFTYEVIDDDILRCKIDILIEGREEVKINENDEIQIEELEREEQVVEKENIIIEEQEDTKIAEIEEKMQTIEKEELKKTNDRDCDGELESEEEDLPIKETTKTIETKEEEKIEKTTETVEKEQIKDLINKVEREEIDENETFVEKEEPVMKENKPTLKVNSLFASLGDESDTFTTYSVYIMRENDSLEKVMDKYKVKKEDLEMYNDLSTVELNSKVIIPTKNNE